MKQLYISRLKQKINCDGLQKNQRILTGIILGFLNLLGTKKTPACWGFPRQQNNYLAGAGLGAGAVAAGLASFFGSAGFLSWFAAKTPAENKPATNIATIFFM
jgi:hypothetical protein